MNVLNTVKKKCTECLLCQKECRFLQKYGTPKSIAAQFNPEKEKFRSIPFECSLCGLCRAVCPEELYPHRMFLEMRRTVIRLGGVDLKRYAALLNYERKGTSRRYRYYGIPDHCDTVFFPGCALPGTRPDRVINVFDTLKKSIPHLGIVLDCCIKPSHDLGRQDYFQSLFGEMRGYLVNQGIKTILAACPNCYQIFREYGAPLQIKTVYEVLAENNRGSGKGDLGIVTVHDPCVTRFDKTLHQSVRDLIQSRGASIIEMDHHRANTFCCGEGGAVGFINPGLANQWGIMRKLETRGQRILTYCAGCTSILNKLNPTSHVLDFFYASEATLRGKIKASKAPMTYWNRLRLKRKLKKMIPHLPQPKPQA
jgi:Fe-S oxidoreductase